MEKHLISFSLITQADDIPPIAEEFRTSKVVALDIETTALSPFDGQIRLLTLWIKEKIYIIDLFQTKTLGPLKEALEDKNIIKIGHGLKFETKWFKFHYDIELDRLFDTYRASAILYNGKNFAHDLYSVYERELGIPVTVQDLQTSNWGGPLSPEQLDYAAFDVQHLPKCREVMRQKIVEIGLTTIAQIEFDVVLPEAVVELNGFKLDADKWMAVAEEKKKKKEELRKVLVKELPNPSDQLTFPGMDPFFNLDSPPQLLKSLKKMGLAVEATNELELVVHAAQYPCIKQIFAYREASHSLSSFGSNYLEHIDSRTGRIHCNYFPFTGAGRYSHSSPNIGQIPRDKIYRACFVPEHGWRYVAADYSGVEMRVAAEIAGDKTLTDVFNRGLNVHQYTASLLNNIPYENITKDQKQSSKACNFGLIFGMGAPKLVLYALTGYGVVMSLKQAEDFRNTFFKSYNAVKSWQERTVREGQRTLLIRTIGGRLRNMKEGAFSDLLNTGIQGTAADALKKALRLVYERLKKSFGSDARMTHHLHDEIIVEAKDEPELVKSVKNEVVQGMKEALQTFLKTVPVDVEAKDGYSWAEVK